MALQSYGPQNPECAQMHRTKYRQPGETFRDAMTRVASKLTEDRADDFQHFRDILLNMRFLPGGRIQSAIGSSKATTPYNCYVSGTIEDSFTAGSGSIMSRAAEAANTMRMGGGIGYDFSTLRPRGALIKKLSSHSSGPIPFMEIFDAVCRATSSSGARRGAQMGVLRVDHPDIEEFIKAKQNTSYLTGFNISVGITDEFMRAVKADLEFTLRFGNQPFRNVRARDLWDSLMRSTFDYAEPGVLFIDRINALNNLRYCETIAATNPCGEQPLPPFGACLLGSFNLTQYLKRDDLNASWKFDFEQFAYDIPYVVRAMDHVVDVARYPLHEQENEAISKRRMGLGVTGAANAIEAILGGPSYGTDPFCRQLAAILRTLRNSAYEASSDLAAETEPFPLFDPKRYLESEFIQTLDLEVQDKIREHGIRNSHLLSIAPTGTISYCADNVSSGIEPVFSHRVSRTIIEAQGTREVDLVDYGVQHLGVSGKTAKECSVQDHLNVLITASKYVDSAVSKTCNVPTDISWEDFKNIYLQAFDNGAKGCTTFRPGGKRFGILKEAEIEADSFDGVEATVDPENLVCEVDPSTGRRNCE